MKKKCPQCKQEQLVYEEFQVITISRIYEFNEDGKVSRNKSQEDIYSGKLLKNCICLNCGYKKKIK